PAVDLRRPCTARRLPHGDACPRQAQRKAAHSPATATAQDEVIFSKRLAWRAMAPVLSSRVKLLSSRAKRGILQVPRSAWLARHGMHSLACGIGLAPRSPYRDTSII